MSDDKLADYVTVREAADRSGFGLTHLQGLARTGRIEARRIGPTWIIKRQSLDAYVSNPATRGPYPKLPRR